jgi:hypothetical protein
MGGGSQIKICISPPPRPPRSLKQSQLTPIHVKCKQAGHFMQKYDRARGELLLYTDQPRMMNGGASVSNCISILCCITNKEDAEKELFSGAVIEAVRLFMFLRRQRPQTISWREI